MSVREGCVDIQTNAIRKQSNQRRLRTVQQHTTHLYSSNRIATLDSEREREQRVQRQRGRPKADRSLHGDRQTNTRTHPTQSVTSSTFSYLLYMFLHFVRPRSSVLIHTLTSSLPSFRQHCYLTRRTHISFVRPCVLQTDTLACHVVAAILG